MNNCINRVDDVTFKLLKYGAAFASVIIRAGYSEFSAPEVVATIPYTACAKGEFFSESLI